MIPLNPISNYRKLAIGVLNFPFREILRNPSKDMNTSGQVSGRQA